MGDYGTALRVQALVAGVPGRLVAAGLPSQLSEVTRCLGTPAVKPRVFEDHDLTGYIRDASLVGR